MLSNHHQDRDPPRRSLQRAHAPAHIPQPRRARSTDAAHGPRCAMRILQRFLTGIHDLTTDLPPVRRIPRRGGRDHLHQGDQRSRQRPLAAVGKVAGPPDCYKVLGDARWATLYAIATVVCTRGRGQASRGKSYSWKLECDRPESVLGHVQTARAGGWKDQEAG